MWYLLYIRWKDQSERKMAISDKSGKWTCTNITVYHKKTNRNVSGNGCAMPEYDSQKCALVSGRIQWRKSGIVWRPSEKNDLRLEKTLETGKTAIYSDTASSMQYRYQRRWCLGCYPSGSETGSGTARGGDDCKSWSGRSEWSSSIKQRGSCIQSISCCQTSVI